MNRNFHKSPQTRQLEATLILESTKVPSIYDHNVELDVGRHEDFNSNMSLNLLMLFSITKIAKNVNAL